MASSGQAAGGPAPDTPRAQITLSYFAEDLPCPSRKPAGTTGTSISFANSPMASPATNENESCSDSSGPAVLLWPRVLILGQRGGLRRSPTCEQLGLTLGSQPGAWARRRRGCQFRGVNLGDRLADRTRRQPGGVSARRV